MAKTPKLSHEALSDFFSALSSMLHAGYPLSDCVLLISEEEKDRRIAALYLKISNELEEGITFADALRSSGAFSAHTVGLINVGESVGMLEESISSLAKFHRDRHRIGRQIRDAVSYPVILVFLMVVVITVLLTTVVPVFEDVYASLGGSMTGTAGGLLALGQWLSGALPVFFAVIVMLFSLAALIYLIPPAGKLCKRLFLTVFGDCGIMRSINNASFASALSIAVNSGIPFEEGVEFAAELLGDNKRAAARCRKCARLLEEGLPLDEALRATGLLPPTCCSILKLGIRTGTGDRSIAQISERLTEESERLIADTVALIEPTIVVVTSVITGVILLTVMLPLIKIMNVI